MNILNLRSHAVASSTGLKASTCVSSTLIQGSMEVLQTNESSDDGIMGAVTQSFVMILVSEVGDKTFLIAAILAMRHPRIVVFAGAFGSLVTMSCLSAAMGHILPTLIPKIWTQYAAAALFLVFGIKMLVEAIRMKPGSEKIQEELKEVQEEIEVEEAEIDGTGLRGEDGEIIPLEAIEEGGRHEQEDEQHSPTALHRNKSRTPTIKEGARNFFSLMFGQVFVQAFVLTFLGEWGDRSQIATIALAAAHNLYVVAVGTILGHACCTTVAVLGGRLLSTKISVKHVTLGGSFLFLLFSILYFYDAWTFEEGITVISPVSNSTSQEIP